MTDAVDVGLDLDQPPLGLQPFHHAAPGLEAVQAFEIGTRLGGHPTVEVDHAHARQVVAAADFVVVRIVEGRHLDQPGAELGVDVLVGDQPEPPAEEGQPGRASGEVAVALVFRVEGDGSIPEHRLRPRRGHDQRLLGRGAFRERLQGVGEVVEAALDLAVLHLEVGNRRPQHRRPVDHVLAAVDQALFVEAHEGGTHRERQAVVEREPLA